MNAMNFMPFKELTYIYIFPELPEWSQQSVGVTGAWISRERWTWMSSGWFQLAGMSSPQKWKTWEVVQGLIKSSDCTHWEQLSSSLSLNIGNQILLLTFLIKGHLLYGWNDQPSLPENLTALNELEYCGQSHDQQQNLIYKINTDIKLKGWFTLQSKRSTSNAINACAVLLESMCRIFGAWISRPWHRVQPNRRNSLPSLLVWHKLNPGAFCLTAQTTILHHKSSLICMVVAGTCCQVCKFAAPFVKACQDCTE